MQISAYGRTMATWGYTPRANPGVTGETRTPESTHSEQGAIPAEAQRGSSLPPVQEEGRTEQDGARSSLQKQRIGECQTCKDRKYQDGSNDPGVSCKTPTRFAPETAASAVRSHELEHVNREQDKARQSGRKVVSQSVTYHTAICPECGKAYVSGGETRTVTKGKDDLSRLFQAGLPESLPQVGNNFSAVA